MNEGPARPSTDQHGIRVTVTDLTTGEVQTAEFDNDYLLVCAGTCYLDGVQTYTNGTNVLTVKGRKQ